MTRVLSQAERKLQYSAERSWEQRWRFVEDMNGDGAITISDVWLWIKWVFFAPGDWALLVLMKYLTPIAAFLEINPVFLQGWISALCSLGAWVFFIGIMGSFVNWNLQQGH